MAKTINRRDFLKTTAAAAAGATLAFPAIVPSSVLGRSAPSNKIQIGQIGCGRIAREHDLPGVLPYDACRVTAVCDLDAKRLKDGKELVESFYAKKMGRPGAVATPRRRGFLRSTSRMTGVRGSRARPRSRTREGGPATANAGRALRMPARAGVPACPW